ncbi:hypothetical protein [Paenibacillus piri]|uniref:Uncharacterized protein n=1 Tax=Paenibacillus piri TaxID=2547395 RepID=A0A4V2ZTE1_9BACL|nr:hypothetical protein [Paenibacillus piri]TDF96364.1 hypothetical protein E1757_18490 [Paenibacillus piri]
MQEEKRVWESILLLLKHKERKQHQAFRIIRELLEPCEPEQEQPNKAEQHAASIGKAVQRLNDVSGAARHDPALAGPRQFEKHEQ